MLAGGFNLRKWVSNDPVLREYFKKNENMENNFKETGDDTSFTESQFSSANTNLKRVIADPAELGGWGALAPYLSAK